MWKCKFIVNILNLCVCVCVSKSSICEHGLKPRPVHQNILFVTIIHFTLSEEMLTQECRNRRMGVCHQFWDFDLLGLYSLKGPQKGKRFHVGALVPCLSLVAEFYCYDVLGCVVKEGVGAILGTEPWWVISGITYGHKQKMQKFIEIFHIATQYWKSRTIFCPPPQQINGLPMYQRQWEHE